MAEESIAADGRRAPKGGNRIARGHEKARQSGHADQGQYGQAEQRAQIAGARQDHEPRDAAPRHGHTDTKKKAADERAGQALRGGEVARLGQHQIAASDHDLHREKREGEAQRPCGHGL